MLKQRLYGDEPPPTKTVPTSSSHVHYNEGRPRSDSRVFERTELWKQGKENQLSTMRKKRQQEEDAACTFNPKINVDFPNRNVGGNVIDRLYQSKKQTNTTLMQQRKKRLQQETEECTFQPTLNRNMWTETVEPRYLNGTESSQSSKVITSPEDEECTFKPQITHYQPVAAQPYLETNAFERLSMSANHIIDDKSVRQSQRWRAQVGKEPRRRANSSSVRGHKDPMNNFFERLKKKEERRLENLEQIRANEPGCLQNFTPEINSRSRHIASGRSGNFFERLGTDIKRRETRENQTRAAHDIKDDLDECSFRPTITPVAQSLRGRTCNELSKGDLDRQQEKLRRQALERHNKELEGCPFQPQLNVSAYNIRSKVSVKTDPSAYIAWAKHRAEQRQHYLASEKQKREDEDLKNCTFKPQIHSAPGYVSAIAASVNLAKPPPEPEAPPHTFGYD
eukprot:TRINITY_DN2331_c4_g1_i2.p1 TRINITY_DN2331_c4_g1~~TRINITY_DN2331_c4_g1_i2.p1  ORF type:complete len:527 (+),score=87.05 TRINITY_DN2331_c4_g1_i2:231-1583(+)